MIDSVKSILLELTCLPEHLDAGAKFETLVSTGYAQLVKLYDLDASKEDVYTCLNHQYDTYQNAGDELKADLLADLMDFVCGFCSPCWRIWDSDGKFDRTK